MAVFLLPAILFMAATFYCHCSLSPIRASRARRGSHWSTIESFFPASLCHRVEEHP